MNLYRGCTHGCIYCDSRSKCYEMAHDFEDVEVKADAPAMLEAELIRKRRKGMIATGAMSDPYLPLEKTLHYTRACLEAIARRGFGISILTKSDLILRDLDLLVKINRQTKCVVQMTLTTCDETLCRIIEPNVCTTHRRFETLKILRVTAFLRSYGSLRSCRSLTIRAKTSAALSHTAKRPAFTAFSASESASPCGKVIANIFTGRWTDIFPG